MTTARPRPSPTRRRPAAGVTDPTPVSLPVWESMVADYGDPYASPPGKDADPVRLEHRPPVPAPLAEAATVVLPTVRTGSTALTTREAS